MAECFLQHRIPVRSEDDFIARVYLIYGHEPIYETLSIDDAISQLGSRVIRIPVLSSQRWQDEYPAGIMLHEP